MGAGGLVVPDVRRLCLWQGSGESDVNGTDAREEVLRDAPLHAAVLGLPRPLPWALEEAPGRRYKPRFSEQVDRENPQHCEREQRKASGALREGSGALHGGNAVARPERATGDVQPAQEGVSVRGDPLWRDWLAGGPGYSLGH